MKTAKNKTPRKTPRSIIEPPPSRKWRGNIFTISLFLIATATPIMAHAGEDYYGHHSMMGGYWGMNGMWLFGWIFGILIIVALVVFIIWMIKKIQEQDKKK